MEAEDLLDKIAQDEGFGNWETVVLNCHHSFIYSLSVAAVHEALRQSHVSGELAAFRQWAEEHYGIGYHDMVWQEWEKYHAANYR